MTAAHGFATSVTRWVLVVVLLGCAFLAYLAIDWWLTHKTPLDPWEPRPDQADAPDTDPTVFLPEIGHMRHRRKR